MFFLFSTRYNLKYVVKETKPDKERKESESVSSSKDGDEDLEEFNDDFAEALDDIDVDELLANHILIGQDDVDDATSTTSSKGKIFELQPSFQPF